MPEELPPPPVADNTPLLLMDKPEPILTPPSVELEAIGRVY
jgi:hypothetical protein